MRRTMDFLKDFVKELVELGSLEEALERITWQFSICRKRKRRAWR